MAAIRPGACGHPLEEDDMTGSTTGVIVSSIVVVIALAAWIATVFYADAHPAWRRQPPSGHGTAGQAAHADTQRQEDGTGSASGETQTPPAASRDSRAPAERVAGPLQPRPGPRGPG